MYDGRPRIVFNSIAGTQFTCFTGAKVQILTLRTHFYINSNSNMYEGRPCLVFTLDDGKVAMFSGPPVLSLFALLEQKYKY